MANNQEKTQGEGEQALYRGNNQMCEAEIDYNMMESFPASDPPSWTLGISPLKRQRSEFDGEMISADEPTHQNESSE